MNWTTFNEDDANERERESKSGIQLYMKQLYLHTKWNYVFQFYHARSHEHI